MREFAKSFAERGYAVLEGIFDRKLIERVGDEIRGQIENGASESAVSLPVGHRRFRLTPQLHGPLLDPDLFANPAILQRMEALLGTDLLIDELTCVVARPGAKAQHVHRDYIALFPELTWCPYPSFAVTVSIPLVDLDEKTGATKVFPGSQKFNRLEETGDSETPYPQRGDCLLMDFNVLHQGLPNSSDADRPVLYIIYARSWFIDMMNFHNQPRLRMDRAEYEQLPDEHRPLFRRLAAKGSFNASEFELRAVSPVAEEWQREYGKS